jgi:5-methylcytosine-specific restriction protein A
MPIRPAKLCKNPFCPNLTRDPSGYCSLHKPAPSIRLPDRRAAPSSRGYDREWRKVREEVLARYDIPRRLWPRYDVDHNPPYNPAIEPDHRKYTLIPRLHAEHSSKTAREDGGFGNGRGESFSSEPHDLDRMGYTNFFAAKMQGGGIR